LLQRATPFDNIQEENTINQRTFVRESYAGYSKIAKVIDVFKVCNYQDEVDNHTGKECSSLENNWVELVLEIEKYPTKIKIMNKIFLLDTQIGSKMHIS